VLPLSQTNEFSCPPVDVAQRKPRHLSRPGAALRNSRPISIPSSLLGMLLLAQIRQRFAEPATIETILPDPLADNTSRHRRRRRSGGPEFQRWHRPSDGLPPAERPEEADVSSNEPEPSRRRHATHTAGQTLRFTFAAARAISEQIVVSAYGRHASTHPFRQSAVWAM
jgi:hypothetical protein